MKEEWRPILGYEGLYEVSSLGRVKSCRYNKILKSNIDRGGYARVPLYRGDGTKLYKQIHRLACISMVCNGIRRTTGGYVFRKKDDIKC